MSIHDNMTTDQYRRAPLNGLIIGVAWVLVLLIPGVFVDDPSRKEKMNLVALVLPALGWLTGL